MPRTLVVILELGLRVPQELSRLEVVAGLDAAVEAAEEAARAVVLLARVPARVALARALVRLERRRVGALHGGSWFACGASQTSYVTTQP